MYEVNFACLFFGYLNRNSHAHEHFTRTGTLPVPVHRYRGILRSLLFMWKSFDLHGNKKNYFFRLGVDPTLLSHFENSPRVTWKWNFLINHFNRASFFTKTTTLFFRQAPY